MENKYIQSIKNKMLDYEIQTKKKEQYIDDETNKKLYMLSEEGKKERKELIDEHTSYFSIKLNNTLCIIKDELLEIKYLNECELQEFNDSLEYIKKIINKDYKSKINDYDLYKLKEHTNEFDYIQHLCHKNGIITYKDIIIITPFSKHYNTLNKVSSISSNMCYEYDGNLYDNSIFDDIKKYDDFKYKNEKYIEEYTNKELEEYKKTNDYLYNDYESVERKIEVIKNKYKGSILINYKIDLLINKDVSFKKLNFKVIKMTRDNTKEITDKYFKHQITHNLKLNLINDIVLILDCIDKQYITYKSFNKYKEKYHIKFFNTNNHINAFCDTLEGLDSKSLYGMYLKEISKDIDSLFDKDFILLSKKQLLNSLDDKTKSIYDEFIKNATIKEKDTMYEEDKYIFDVYDAQRIINERIKEEHGEIIIYKNNKEEDNIEEKVEDKDSKYEFYSDKNNEKTTKIIAIVVLIIIAIFLTR